MSTEADVLDRFYRAFTRLDAEAMAACYHPEVRFSDPAFPALSGPEAGDMWRMMASRAVDFRLEAGPHSASAGRGQGFAATGRRVANPIRSSFVFRDGLIVEQRDEFDFHAWARQALGLPGLLLGWTPWLRRKVQRQAAAGLAAFRAKRR
jgi:ketosteroid isomerase-like protein